MTTPLFLFLLFLAGGCGSLARYGLGTVVKLGLGDGFPFATSIVNALGCLLFGLVAGLADARVFSDHKTLILTVGFLGAFTTFSTLAYEAEEMLRASRWLTLAIYLVSQNLLGILFVYLGLRIVR